MDKEQGLQVIEQALQVANSKGAFNLKEASIIYTTLNTIKDIFQEIDQSKIVNVGEKKGK